MSAIQGTVTKFLSLADGTLRIQVDVHHGDTSTALGLLCEVGTTVAVARLVDGETEPSPPDEEPAEDTPAERGKDPLTGKVMKHFYTSGFFQSPKVCRALGLDAEFLQWLRHQTCWHCGKQDMTEGGEFYVQAAHVRRVGSGAGTGTKPQYSAIPLCSKCHDIQHAVGESGIAPREWWEEKAARARQEWGHQKLRNNFGVESISAEVGVDSLWDWLKARDLLNFVPAKVRRDVEGQRA